MRKGAAPSAQNPTRFGLPSPAKHFGSSKRVNMYEIMNLCYKTRKKCEDLAAENISTWNKNTKYGTISSVHALAAAMLAPEGILLAS